MDPDPAASLDLAALQATVASLRADPRLLVRPELTFFVEYLHSLGARVPSASAAPPVESPSSLHSPPPPTLPLLSEPYTPTPLRLQSANEDAALVPSATPEPGAKLVLSPPESVARPARCLAQVLMLGNWATLASEEPLDASGLGLWLAGSLGLPVTFGGDVAILTDLAIKQARAAREIDGHSGDGCGEATLVLHILRLFQAYTHFGLGSLEGLDNERFIKLMSDGSVIDDRLTPAVTSMVFSKCKSKYLEKMDFAQFLGSLVVLAEVKGVPALVLARELIQAPGLSQIHSGATPRQAGQGYVGAATPSRSFLRNQQSAANIESAAAGFTTPTSQMSSSMRTAYNTPNHEMPLSQRLQVAPKSVQGRGPSASVTSRVHTYTTHNTQRLEHHQPPAEHFAVRLSKDKAIAHLVEALARADIPYAVNQVPAIEGAELGDNFQAMLRSQLTCSQEATITQGLVTIFRDHCPSVGSSTAEFPRFMSRGRDVAGLKMDDASTAHRLRMDGKGFAKLCRELHLTSSRLTVDAVDVLFSKLSSSVDFKLDFKSFLGALKLIAMVTEVRYESDLAILMVDRHSRASWTSDGGKSTSETERWKAPSTTFRSPHRSYW